MLGLQHVFNERTIYPSPLSDHPTETQLSNSDGPSSFSRRFFVCKLISCFAHLNRREWTAAVHRRDLLLAHRLARRNGSGNSGSCLYTQKKRECLSKINIEIYTGWDLIFGVNL